MKIRLLFWLAMTILPPWASAAQEVSQPPAPKLSFDPKMFKGLGISPQLLEQFNSAQDLPAGRYRLDVFLNEQLRFRKELELRADTSGRQWICIDNALLAELGVEPRVSPQETCADLVKLFPGATAELEGGRLQYQISMPQAYLSKSPRGEVARGDLDAGITALTLNYLGNYQLVQTEGRQSYTRQSAYLSLNAGMNLGQWQLRQQGALQHDQDRGLRYQNLRTYVQRPLVDWGSEMVVGQTFTSGRFLSALGFNGLTLRTDERMLPDSMRGFAPVVRGVAQTNARVTVRQNGFQIYQTTVAPGSFEISDLYATSLSGDLDVEVLENDGRVRLFTVPFSAVPESLREGAGRYDIALGRTRTVGEGTDFFDAVYSRGLSNSWTATGGLRLAGGYRSAVLGGVFNSSLGAFGGDFTYASATANGLPAMNGWMAHLSFSRMFQTSNTVVTLSGYRYSTEGYRDLSDVIGLRAVGAAQWNSATYMQRNRFHINVNQPLGKWGSMYVAASTGSYRNGRSDDNNLQLGYSKSFGNGVSVNFALARQRIGALQTNNPIPAPMLGDARENTAMLSVSFPLDGSALARPGHVAVSAVHSANRGEQVQATYSGVQAQDDSLSYSVTASHGNDGSKSSLAANAQKRFNNATLGVNASRGSGYWQLGASTQGAAVVHSGGLTLGPYLGETAALVEAVGAEGARVWGGVSGRVNDNGFVLVPSVIPYRYNNITLDPQGMTGDFDLLASEQRVAPYAGSLVRLKYQTRGGRAMLIRVRLPNGSSIPMGADVYADGDEPVAMVGQGNQIYLRAEKSAGQLLVKWGDSAAERCTLDYATTSAPAHAPVAGITMLERTCR